jgi:hypothetical protein
LLGVTPELAALPTSLVAVDWSAEMIRQVWPGNGASRRVVRADWRALPLAAESIHTVIGDGSFNMLRYPDDYVTVLAQLHCVMGKGGRIAMRCFTSPETTPAAAEVQMRALRGDYSGFHELKWRVATLAVRETGNVNIGGRAILDRFDALFPDRAALSRATGWTLDVLAEIDEYRDAGWTMSFPTRCQFETALPGARWGESGDYAMAELCPILVIDL